MKALSPTKFVEKTYKTFFGDVYKSTPSMRADRNWKGDPELLQRWVCEGKPDLYLPLTFKA